MADSESDDVQRLVVAWDSRANAVDVYKQLADPMRQAARWGLRFVLSATPNEDDVDDVVFKAFPEVLKATSKHVKRDPVAFAKVVAKYRGIDRGRAILRERQRLELAMPEIVRIRVTDEDIAAAGDRERLLEAAQEAINHLTADQRDVIERTVMGQETLSDWTLRRGTTYEAGRQLRARGLNAMRKHINSNKGPLGEGKVD